MQRAWHLVVTVWPAAAHRIARFVVVFAGVVAGVVVWALPAQAHPTLLATLPEAGYSFADAPEVIGVVFDEPVTIHYLRLQGQARGSIDTTRPQVSAGGRQVAIRPHEPLPDGSYTVRWKVTAQDGDIVDGSYGFGVGRTASASEEPGTEGLSTWTGGLRLAALLRWVLFAGLALVAGGLTGDRLMRARMRRASPERDLASVKPWLLPGAVLGLVASGGLLVHQVGGGRLLAALRDAALGQVVGTGAARLLVVELVAFGVAALAAVGSSRPVLAAAVVAVVVVEGVRSHVRADGGLIGGVVIAAHLLAAAVWVGALIHAVRTALRWRHEPGQIKALFKGYAYLAGWLYAVVVSAGTIAAVLVLPTLASLWTTGYGLVLLVKLALVALVTVAALAARRRLSRPVEQEARAPLPAARVEGVALVGVLAISALLTAVTPPADPRQGVAYPPPAYEPTIRLGALTGQVTTGIVASKGQLEVRLRVPESDPSAEQAYDVAGTLARPGGKSSELPLRPCGTGCFFADAEWFPGVSKLELSIRADGFTGGRARFDVPQPHARPARDAQQMLKGMLAAMRRTPRLVFTEAVTSDTSRPTPRAAARYRETGTGLIDLQPYRTGTVNGPTILNRQGGITAIGFAISAENIYVRVWINERGRILREQLVTPGHLITRTYVYP